MLVDKLEIVTFRVHENFHFVALSDEYRSRGRACDPFIVSGLSIHDGGPSNSGD